MKLRLDWPENSLDASALSCDDRKLAGGVGEDPWGQQRLLCSGKS